MTEVLGGLCDRAAYPRTAGRCGCGVLFSWITSHGVPASCFRCEEARRAAEDAEASRLWKIKAAAWEKVAAAREATRAAIRSGVLTPKKSCESCGGSKPDQHHRDYSDPLAITWLCKSCHGREHGRLARAGLDPVLLFALAQPSPEGV